MEQEKMKIIGSATKAEAYDDEEEGRATGNAHLLLRAAVFWAEVSARRRSARYLVESDIDRSVRLINEAIGGGFDVPDYLRNASRVHRYIGVMEAFLHDKGYQVEK